MSHYQRNRRYGDPLAGAPKRSRKNGKPRLWERQCSIPGCAKFCQARDMCTGHYQKWQKYGDPLAGKVGRGPKRGQRLPDRFCSVDGCGGKVVRTSSGLCSMHLQRYIKTGDPGPADRMRAVRGTGSISTEGYRRVGAKGRPEHRVVMERILGRSLRQDENVHHLNGVRHDNRPENLELWMTQQPIGQRVSDLVAWAKEILNRYDSPGTPGQRCDGGERQNVICSGEGSPGQRIPRCSVVANDVLRLPANMDS